MIPSLISLLALLVVGVSSVAFNYEACYGSDASLACFLPGGCIIGKYTEREIKSVYQLTDSSQKSMSDCFATVAFKKYADDKWLVILLADGMPPSKDISIRLGSDQTLFGCNADDWSTVTVNSGSFVKEVYATSVRKSSHLLCKFTVKGSLSQKLNSGGHVLTLVLQSGPKTFNMASNVLFAAVQNTRKCNPDHLKYHSEPTADGETSIRPLVEFGNVQCDPGTKLYALHSGKRFEATINCEGGAYKIAKISGGALNLQSQVACSAKTCTRCEEVTAFNSGTKPGWAPPNGNTCATLTCTGDRIQVLGSNSTVAKPYCKQFGDTGDFRWTIKYGSVELPFTEAACMTSVKCNDVQPLRVIASSSPIDPWAPKIACVDTNYQLAARASATAAWTLIEAITCDTATGEWEKVFPGTEKKLLPAEEIKCLNDDEVEAAKDAAEQTDNDRSSTKSPSPADAGMSTAAIVSIAIVSVSVVILIAGFAFFTIRRKRREQAEIGEVDAKPPTPPVTADSDKQFGNEVSFSGNRATPSLKTPQPDPTAPKLKMKQIPEAKQLEEAVSVTAHPIPLKVEQYSGTSDKSTPPPPPPPADVDVSKKKVVDLLEQSVPSMSE